MSTPRSCPKTKRGFRGVGGWLLFILPMPLLVAAIVQLARDQLIACIYCTIGFGLYSIAAILTRQGIKRDLGITAHADWRARFPFRWLATVLIGATTAGIAWLVLHNSIAVSTAYAVLAALGFILCYDLDQPPSVAQLAENISSAQARVALAQAEKKLGLLEKSHQKIAHAELDERLFAIIVAVRKILSLIETDPHDLARARKFLNIYLASTVEVVDRYTKLPQLNENPEIQEKFKEMLIAVEKVCADQHKKLLENDLLDLDTQIEVLQQQLKYEGIG